MTVHLKDDAVWIGFDRAMKFWECWRKRTNVMTAARKFAVAIWRQCWPLIMQLSALATHLQFIAVSLDWGSGAVICALACTNASAACCC